MILHMAKFDTQGQCIGLCKVKVITRILKIMEKRGYVEIDKEEWEALHQQWRLKKLGEMT